ncbi:MAG: hypothetical protein JWN48_5290 [Myxococcaceae bacterium]|nr:hypothetical protein [Myxococcaceae bacterium]
MEVIRLARFDVLARQLARPLALLALVCLSWLGGSVGKRAHAQPADSNQEARTTFEQGVEASRAQHWEEAREKFERSLALVPKPSTMFNLALAYLKLGLGRQALAQLDAFEHAATPGEHAAMLARAQVLRPQAQALVDSAQSKAQSGGNALSRSDDGLSAEVRQDVAEARDNYAKGRDKQALDGFERAYQRSKRPELLYNIGVVADRLRNDRRAIAAYDAFVEALPDAREAAVAQVRSEALRVALEHDAAERPAEAKSAQTLLREVGSQPAPLERPRGLLIAGGVVSAVALGTLLGSTVALATQKSNWDRCLNTSPTAPKPCRNVEDVRFSKHLAIGGAVASAVVLATGVGLAVVGAVKLSRWRHRQVQVALLPSLSLGAESAASILAIGRF